MEDFVPWGSVAYWVFLGALVFSRGMDFLSTWLATPNLVLEANPIARWMGWRGGIVVNLLVCVACARWPLPAIVISTTSLLVAARNLQNVWLMRTMGEVFYRSWMAQRICETRIGMYILCVLLQTLLIASIGFTLVIFSRVSPDELHIVPFGIGMGIIAFAGAVAFYTLLSVWRIRRSVG